MKNQRGQILVAAIVMLVILAILVPVMVQFTRNESVWSIKESRSTAAFHLADAALERAYNKVTESTITWQAIQNGVIPAGYSFDKAYTDQAVGSYAISVTSGPGEQQVTVIAVGRALRGNETRALKAIYTNLMTTSAIYGGGGVTTNNGTIEWGAVISPKDVNTSNQYHPQFYSAGNVSPQDGNGATPPNTDGVSWWSYYAGIPPSPSIDFDAYKSSAQATGTYFDEGIPGVAPPGNSHPCGSLKGLNSQTQGYTWYFNCPTHGVRFTSDGNTFIQGTVIVIGNISVDASATNGDYVAAVPPAAWKQYGSPRGSPDAWTYFQNKFNPGNLYPSIPNAFPGMSSSYVLPSNMTFHFTQGFVRGFVYASGNAVFGSGGNGLTQVHGSAYIAGTVTLIGNSQFEVYYDASSAKNLLLTKIYLTRDSWQEATNGWPASAGP